MCRKIALVLAVGLIGSFRLPAFAIPTPIFSIPHSLKSLPDQDCLIFDKKGKNDPDTPQENYVEEAKDYWTLAEKWVWHKLCRGEVADLGSNEFICEVNNARNNDITPKSFSLFEDYIKPENSNGLRDKLIKINQKYDLDVDPNITLKKIHLENGLLGKHAT